MDVKTYQIPTTPPPIASALIFRFDPPGVNVIADNAHEERKLLLLADRIQSVIDEWRHE